MGKSNTRIQNIYCTVTVVFTRFMFVGFLAGKFLIASFSRAQKERSNHNNPNALRLCCTHQKQEFIMTKSIRNEIDLVPIDHWLWAFTRFFNVLDVVCRKNHTAQFPAFCRKIRFYALYLMVVILSKALRIPIHFGLLKYKLMRQTKATTPTLIRHGIE